MHPAQKSQNFFYRVPGAQANLGIGHGFGLGYTHPLHPTEGGTGLYAEGLYGSGLYGEGLGGTIEGMVRPIASKQPPSRTPTNSQFGTSMTSPEPGRFHTLPIKKRPVMGIPISAFSPIKKGGELEPNWGEMLTALGEHLQSEAESPSAPPSSPRVIRPVKPPRGKIPKNPPKRRGAGLPKFVKGSPEAKAHMAKLRKMRGGAIPAPHSRNAITDPSLLG